MKDIYSDFWDGPHATPIESEKGPIYLGIKNISEDGHIDLSEIRHISEEDYPLWTKRVVPCADDIVFSYEATLNRYAMIPKNFRGCLGRRLALIRTNPEKAYAKFLYYYFFGEEWRNTIASHTISGSTVDRIPLIEFPEFEIHIPPLPTQLKIAAILSAYDDLIENNTRRIRILEQMAQTIYREWFVHFRYPGHQNTHFTDSSIGRIPEGWSVKKIREILKEIKRGIKIQKQDYTSEGLIPVVDQGKEFIGGFTNNMESLISDDLPLIIFGDHTRVLKFIDFPFACGADGTQLLKSNDERMPITLFYYALSAIDLSDFGYARHFKFLKEETLVLPNKSIADIFDQFVMTIRTQTSLLMQINTCLRHTRDLLLPKLISGELDVSELEIVTGEPNG